MAACRPGWRLSSPQIQANSVMQVAFFLRGANRARSADVVAGMNGTSCLCIMHTSPYRGGHPLTAGQSRVPWAARYCLGILH